MTGSNRSQSFTTTSSNDSWAGGRGNDIATYNATDNAGDHDVLDGGSGRDTLVLQLTRAQWFNHALQNDIARFLRGASGCNNNGVFEFSAFDLDVRGFEAIRIFVDGVELSGRDDRVATRNDRFSLTENGSVAGNVLANDRIADLARAVEVTSGPSAGALTFNADGTFTYSAGNAFDWLASGQTTTVSFTYRVTDADGDRDTATVTLTINGGNDGPVITGGMAAGTVTEIADNAPGENAVTHMASGQITFTDADLSDTHTVSFLPEAGGYLGTFTVSFMHAGDAHDDDDDDHDGHHNQNGQGHHSHGNGRGNGHDSDDRDECNDDDRDGHQHQIGRGHREHGNGNGYGHNEHDGGACTGRGTLTWKFHVADSAIDFLAAGETRTQNYTLTINDGHGGTVQQAVTVTLRGTNDTPVIGAAVLAGEVTELADGAAGENTLLQSAIGTIDFADVDLIDGHIVAVTPNGSGYRGTLTALISNVSTGDGAGRVSWTYSVNDAALDDLGATDHLTQTYSITIDDGHGGLVSRNVVITIDGAADGGGSTPATIGVPSNAHVIEDATTPLLTATGSISISDPDAGEASFQATVTSTPGNLGTLALAASGSYTYSVPNAAVQYLGVNETRVETFTVTAFDGTTRAVSFTVTGTNDGPVAQAESFLISIEGAAPFIDSIVATDVDANAILSYALDGSAPAGLTLNSNGSYTFDPRVADYQSLGVGQSTVLTIPYTVTDDHGATATGNLVITVHGTNDAPVAQAASFTVAEDAAVISGNVVATDVDANAVLSYSPIGALPAGLNLFFDGSYTFDAGNAAYQSLGVGQSIVLTMPYTVTDDQGATSSANFAISVLGTNDAPFAGVDGADVVEAGINTDTTPFAGVPSATGNLLSNDTDIDLGDGKAVQGVAHGTGGGVLTTGVGATILGTYGSLVLNANGTFTYTLDNTDPDTDALDRDALALDMFTYTMRDTVGATSTSLVGIRVTGANDAPVATDSVARTNQGTLIEGQLTACDVDAGAVLTFTTDLDPVHGTVTIDMDGHFIFIPASGFAGSDSFTFTVHDGRGGVDTGRVDITVDAQGRQNVTYLYSGADVQNEAWGGQQAQPDVVALPNGGHLVVWSVANAAVNGTTAGGAYEIWGQRWTADGERDGSSFRLNEPRNTNQQWASIDVFTDGSFVAVWESAGQDGGGTSNGIVGRRFNADGTPSTGEFVVNTITAFNEEQPTVRTLSDGGFIVTWTGTTPANNGSQDVYARVYDAAFDLGTGLPVPRTTGIVVNAATAVIATQLAQGQLGETVLVLDATHVVVLFADNSGGNMDVRARIIDPTSAATIAASPPDFRVNTTLIGDQQIASATKLANGDFVVVWQQTRTDGLYIPTRTDIYLQRFNADGSFDGVETKVNTFDRFEQTTPRVAATPDGGFAVVWQSQTVDGSANNKLAYQKYDALGLKTGSEMIVDADNRFEGMQTPDLIAREDGALVVVWADQGSFGRSGGNRWIGQQVIDEAGDVTPIENTELDALVSSVSSPNNLRRPDVVALADGGHLVVWNNGSGDSEGGVITARGVWAQRYHADGTKVAASGSGAGGPFMISTVYPSISPGRDHTAAAALDDGGFVVVWSSFSQTGNGTWDIWGRKFDASGVATGGEFIVTHVVGAPGTVAAGQQQMPSVLGLAGSGFVVSWDNPDASGFNDNVVFKVYSSAVSGGAPVELTGDIVASTAVAQTITQEGDLAQPIARLDDGRFVLTWTAPDSTQTGVYARIVNSDGTFASGAEFRVNTTTNGFERTASAGALDDGGFVVTWTGRLANGQETVMMQRYDATGSPVGVETVVPSYDFNHGTHYAKVEGLHDGGWVVIWQSYGIHGLNNAVDGSYSAGQNDGIAGQRYDSFGSKVGSQFLVSRDSYGAEQKPSFDVRADGAMVVAWLDASGRRVEQLVVDQADDVTYTSDMSLPTVINAGPGIVSGAQYPHTIALQDGGHLTAWFEDANAGTDRGQIHARRYDGDGNQVGAEFVYTAGVQNFNYGSSAPGLAQLADGSIVFTWMYYGPGSSQYALQGRLFDADLNPLGSGNFRADANLQFANGYYSYVEALANGNFVVSWSHAGLNSSDIAARVFEGTINPSTGVPDALSSGFLVNTVVTGTQEQRGAFSGATPIAGLEGGRFVVIWDDSSAYTVPNYTEIKARLYEADGTPATGEFQVNTTLAGLQRYGSVDALEGGGFVVSWLSSANATNSQIPVVAQRFDADGNKVGGEILVNLFDTGSVSDTRVEGLADGGFVVVWASNTTTSFQSIAGQRFDADGEKVDGMFQISETTAVEHLYGPSFDVRTDGTLAVTWNNNNGKIETKIVDFGEVQPKNFTGTDGNDSFIGSRYADDITGGAGNDLLTGGSGRDAFRFNFATDGVDSITDFAHSIDHLAVSATGFGGGLAADQMATLNLATGADMAGFTFASSDGWFFFDQTGAGQGDLYWDADGGSSENAQAIAKLQNVTVLTANDFHIVN